MITVETCPKCGQPLTDEMICTFPPIPAKRCFSCGYYWEGNPEPVEYKPFNANNVYCIPTANEYKPLKVYLEGTSLEVDCEGNVEAPVSAIHPTKIGAFEIKDDNKEM